MEPKSPPATASLHHAALIFSVSAAVMAYEILLMRLFSIGQWHHFAYMVISVALLGFGASGSMLFLILHRVQRDMEKWLVILSGLTAVSFSLGYSLSQKVPLDPLQLVWQPGLWWNMFFMYLLIAVPFMLAGGVVGAILAGAGKDAHRMYAADLLGAGCGAFAVVPALYVGPPWKILPALGILVLCGVSWCCLKMQKGRAGAGITVASFLLLVFFYRALPPLPQIHPTKSLPMTLAFPDARIETEKTGPLGLIQVVKSALIRHVPGLSLNFGLDSKEQGPLLPEQKAIFLDADALSPIARFTGDLGELAYLDFTSMALPYHVRTPAGILVIGPGGGADILLALKHGPLEILALEANRQVADLLLGPYAEFSGNLFQRPGVTIVLSEARQHLQATDKRFDLIQLSLLDSFVSSAGGLHSSTESYLYTTEAFELYLRRLTDFGLIAVTRWLKLPPRDSLKIIATALNALRRQGISNHPEEHLLFIRSWKTSTILISRSPFTAAEIGRARRFCDDRSFDLAYYAGMEAKEANRYDLQDSPYYFLGAQALCSAEAESFMNRYIFDVSAPTDDRPYFAHFFRWDKARELFQYLRREWFPMIELGYVFLLATLLQAIVAGGVLILAPLFLLKRLQGSFHGIQPLPRKADLLCVPLYFGSIGMAFMFLEMALLPKYTLLLAHPVYSAAVVLSSLLISAGAGSLTVRRFQEKRPWFLWLPVIILFLWVLLHILAGDLLFNRVMGWPLWGRVFVAVCFIAIPSFFLGWPFPAGLRVLAGRFSYMVPWAWGINGCASVIGSVLGQCLAISIGFRYLMLAAVALYLLAVIIFHLGLRKRDIPAFS